MGAQGTGSLAQSILQTPCPSHYWIAHIMASLCSSVMVLLLFVFVGANPTDQFLGAKQPGQVVPNVEMAEEMKSPYLATSPTAEALAAVFMFITLVICWLEICGAGKK